MKKGGLAEKLREDFLNIGRGGRWAGRAPLICRGEKLYEGGDTVTRGGLSYRGKR